MRKRSRERSGQICSVGRRKIAKKIAKNKRCYANTLRPRIKDAVEGDEGGLRGSLPPWVIFGGGWGVIIPWVAIFPRYGERGTQPAGCWPKNGITAAAANPEILPLEFLLGDDPVHGSLKNGGTGQSAGMQAISQFEWAGRNDLLFHCSAAMIKHTITKRRMPMKCPLSIPSACGLKAFPE